MLEFYTPSAEELWFKETMLADPQTMAFNHAFGGTIPFPRERWVAWHDKWIRTGGNERFYRYLRQDGIFLGEAAYHWDSDQQMYLADIIVHAPYRGKGYGRRALMMLCEAARSNGVPSLYDQIAIDNPAVKLFLQCGFEKIALTDTYVLLRKNLTL